MTCSPTLVATLACGENAVSANTSRTVSNTASASSQSRLPGQMWNVKGAAVGRAMPYYVRPENYGHADKPPLDIPITNFWVLDEHVARHRRDVCAKRPLPDEALIHDEVEVVESAE